MLKGTEWNSLLFAHPPNLNNRKPIGSADPTLGVCDGGTPYVAISNPKPFDMATYGVPPSQTPKVGSAQPMGFLLFKVDGWANSNGFHSGPLVGSWHFWSTLVT